MGITLNIYGGSAAPAATETQAAMPMAAGASVELAAAQATGATMHDHHAATDAGPPSATLVQEVETALLVARAAAPDAPLQPAGIDAGAAPM